MNKSETSVLAVDESEAQRISQVARLLGLKYVIITSVTRDDLSDGGAAQFAQTIKSIRDINKDIRVEALIPDFSGSIESLRTVINAGPSVLAHNIETVRRLYPELKPRADYALSLEILRKIKEMKPDLATKSALILGLGETEEQVIDTMRDLRSSLCDFLTLGQYLAPSCGHYPVKEFVPIEKFKRYYEIGISLGFKVVLSAPKVRSSYQAEQIYEYA